MQACVHVCTERVQNITYTRVRVFVYVCVWEFVSAVASPLSPPADVLRDAP